MPFTCLQGYSLGNTNAEVGIAVASGPHLAEANAAFSNRWSRFGVPVKISLPPVLFLRDAHEQFLVAFDDRDRIIHARQKEVVLTVFAEFAIGHDRRFKATFLWQRDIPAEPEVCALIGDGIGSSPEDTLPRSRQHCRSSAVVPRVPVRDRLPPKRRPAIGERRRRYTCADSDDATASTIAAWHTSPVDPARKSDQLSRIVIPLTKV